MAVPFTLIKPFILFSLLLCLLSNSKPSNVLISDICRKTRNSSLCLQILTSDRRARAASSFLVLGKISIELANSFARETKSSIDKSLRSIRDIRLKEAYKTCSLNYESAMYYIQVGQHYLNSGDFSSSSNYMAAAVNEPISCKKSFARPIVITMKINQANDTLECLCSVVLVISNKLSGKNITLSF